MTQLRKRFIRDLSIRNYSPRTIQSYVSSIERLSGFYHKCPSEITTEELKEYLNYLYQKGHSWSTVNMAMSACNRLFTDTLNQSHKVQSLKRPKGILSLPVVLSEGEVAAILNTIRNIKHKALLMTCYSAGLRVSELCNLKVHDIDSRRSRIIIRNGKGHKDREVILSEYLLRYLRHYFKLFRPKEYLFYGFDVQKPVSHSTVRHVLRKNLSRSGIAKKASVHTLRHSYATHLMNKGIDIRIIQKLLGHKSIKTTLKYCHLAKDRFGNTKSPLDDLAIW